jgi:hypothetical protein
MKKLLFCYLLFFVHFSAFSIPDSCKNTVEHKCITIYGEKLGENNGVEAYSNCRSLCVNPEPNNISGKSLSLNKDVYTGIKWQCVEFARRWWIRQKGITFGSVESANEIFDLNNAEKLNSKELIILKKEKNFSNNVPKVGNLIIYKKYSDLPYGHVAVVVNVDTKKGYLDLAEANYYNEKWEEPNKYARRIKLELKDNNYILYDIDYAKFDPSKKDNQAKAELILGWVNPEM